MRCKASKVRALVVGALLVSALALPSSATAHRSHSAHNHVNAASALRLCRAVDNNRPPSKLTADQVAAVKAACDAYDAAIAPAKQVYSAAVTQYRTAVSTAKTQLRSDLSAARQLTGAARRLAIKAANTTFRTAVKAAGADLRTASNIYIAAVSGPTATLVSTIKAILTPAPTAPVSRGEALRLCHAISAGHPPAQLTAAQVAAITTACTQYTTTLAPAKQAFIDAANVYKTSLTAARTQLKSDLQAARQLTGAARRAAVRAAFEAYETAVHAANAVLVPAFQTYATAVKAAQDTLVQNINSALTGP